MVYHAVACLLCAWALVTGIRTTSDLDWPFDADHLRDIAHAQTIRDGAWLQDPFYQSEWVWYNPLLPGIIAGISYLTDLEVNVVAARAGAYLNIAAPLTFYMLVLRLTSSPTALAALVGFLFLVHAPTWAAPTYSPWLFGSAFAQPFFYLTLTEYHAASVSGRRRRYATAGILLGLTFLTHTAPAILAASMIVTITTVRTWIEKRQIRELLIILSLVAGSALLIGLPFLVSIAGHYQLRVRNGLPLMWSDPNLPADDWRPLLAMITSRPFVSSIILVGVLGLSLGRLRRLSVAILAAWSTFSIVYFAYNNYLVPNLRTAGMPATVPAHHFLLYGRAAGMVFFGLGVSITGVAVAWALRRVLHDRFPAARTGAIEQGVAAAALLAIVFYAYPAWAARDAFGYERDMAKLQFATPELRAVIPWIRDNTAPSDVFLTAGGSCLAIIGPAGRKCVVPPRFFANPYVDWNAREREDRALWDSLTRQDCDRFRDSARANGVTFVMTVDGRTPRVQSDQCSLRQTRFSGTGIRIYRVSWN
jgi:hypothetical protein